MKFLEQCPKHSTQESSAITIIIPPQVLALNAGLLRKEGVEVRSTDFGTA